MTTGTNSTLRGIVDRVDCSAALLQIPTTSPVFVTLLLFFVVLVVFRCHIPISPGDEWNAGTCNGTLSFPFESDLTGGCHSSSSPATLICVSIAFGLSEHSISAFVCRQLLLEKDQMMARTKNSDQFLEDPAILVTEISAYLLGSVNHTSAGHSQLLPHSKAEL